MLLPALAKAKQQAQSAQCMSNGRQIMVAWKMYSDDNNDLLAPNDFPYETAYYNEPTNIKAEMKNWVCGTMEQAVDASATRGLPELTDPIGTALSPYLRSPFIYHCPADNWNDPNAGNQPHIRSYSMNSAIGTVWWSSFQSGGPALGSPVNGGWLNGSAYQNTQTTWLVYGKASSFTRPGPANTFVIMDENAYSINDGSLAISANASAGATYLIDWPAGNHNQAAGISYADGHSEVHKWMDPRTCNPLLTDPNLVHGQGGQASPSVNPIDPDCYWLAPRASAAVDPSVTPASP